LNLLSQDCVVGVGDGLICISGGDCVGISGPIVGNGSWGSAVILIQK
jgi:hypothetical protein